ncbi:MAG: hypothetical protein NWF10_06520 [Candidatus Bathyarchaeota archaeon]|nr:hypothetical protein [Candidatus Bathyarchaeota archaeon]
MAKAAWVAPLYLSVAWTLMITYQIFTQTAVSTIVTNVHAFVPSLGLWLSSRMDLVIFVYGFAWVFILSSAIPCAILGKERGVVVQFFLCLSLTFLALIMVDVLESYTSVSMGQFLGLSHFFNNLVVASLYLAIPYILMIALDIRSRNMRKQQQNLELLTESYLENSINEEQ